MKKTMLLMTLLAGGLFAAPRVTVGIGFGAPVAAVQPVCPRPGYTWVNGYYEPGGVWIAGYWAPPVAVRIAPRFVHERAFDHHADHFRR